MTPEEMRALGSNWAEIGRTDMRDRWLMTAELAERLDKIIALMERRETSQPHNERSNEND